MTTSNNKRALCVDYSSSNLHVLSSIIEGSGFECDMHTTALDALEELESTHYTIIFANLRPADMDGEAFIKAIRESAGCGELTTIIGTTTSQISAQHATFIAAGCDQILVRPFKMKEVIDIVEGNKSTGSSGNSNNVYKLDIDLASPTESASPARDDQLDTSVVGQLVFDIGSDSVLEAITIFANELDFYKDRIDTAMRQHNQDEVAAGAHTVKSAAEALGITHVARSAEDLETACRLGAEHEDVNMLRKSLLQHVEKFRSFLEKTDLSEYGLSS